MRKRTVLSGLLDFLQGILLAETGKGGCNVMRFLRFLFAPAEDAEYEPYREALFAAGLSERQLRRMDPDERVAALEKANLDPYDYIYLAW